MIIQRKRVAKRLASGLLAGALALGGLAISGGSVSAKTPSSPSTNRIYGADRYTTAVAVARNQIADIGNANNGLIIASGESPYDALAGSVLSASGDRPMVLVQSNAIPEAVSDLLSDYRAAWSAVTPTFYVLGGTSAISSDVFDAIKAAVTVPGDTTPPTVVRVAGDDRYATAKAISEVTAITAASDKLIIVSGENGRWADAISAGFLSAESGWPIVLTNSSGLQDSAKAVIDNYIALGGTKGGYLIIGGPSAVSTSVEDYLITTKAQAPKLVRRIGGADRYQTNFLVNNYALGNLSTFVGFAGSTVALASGESPFDALVAASWAARKNSHMVLTPTAGGNTWVGALSAALGGGANSGLGYNATLYVIGGRNAVSEAAKTGYTTASQGSNLTATLDCPTSSAAGNSNYDLSATLTLSGRLTTVENPHMVSNAAAAKFFKNGSSNYTSGNIVVSDLGALINGTNSRFLYDVSLPATTAVGDTITFSGWVDGAPLTGTNFTPTRSIATASCTYGADVTRPTITSFRAIGPATGMALGASSTTSAGPRIIAEFSEAVSLTASGLIQIVGGSTTNGVVTALNSSNTKYMIQFPTSSAVPTINVTEVELVAANIKDKNDLSPASVPRATIGVDAVPATLSVSAVGVTTSQQAVIDAGDLRVSAQTAALGGSILGAAGTAWKVIVVNQRGLQAPSVAIDETAKTITVTADEGYHTVADVQNAYDSTFDGNWVLTSKTSNTANKVSKTLAPAGCVTTCGEDHVTLTISGNEPFTLGGNVTVNVNGLGAGYIAATAVGTDADYSAADNANRGRYSNTITFTSKIHGAGQIALGSADDGANDTAGNRTAGPLSFTLG